MDLYGALGILMLLVLTTHWLKFHVALSALRVGLNAEALFPAFALLLLSLMLTLLSCGPLVLQILSRLELSQAGEWATTEQAAAALRYLVAFASERAPEAQLQYLQRLSGLSLDTPMLRVGAFYLSELEAAVTWAVYILLPFWVIDIVVAHLVATLGWNLNPRGFSLPLKLMMFVSVGGWQLLLKSLLTAA